jgi:hypothetical protein
MGMGKLLTTDDILPPVACLTPQERVRLLRLITSRSAAKAAAAYRVVPARHDEFSTDEEPLAWEVEGGEDVD